MKYSLCNDWEFTENWSDAFCTGAPVPYRQVRLPHTCRELPLHYADPADYEMVCGYRRTLTVPDAPRLFLRFDGAAHQAAVYVNGQLVGEHLGGYTAFTLEITDFVRRNAENLLAVRLDTCEDPALPPFGFVIDYLTYGGLYREVWLETSAETRVTDLFVHTPALTEAAVAVTVDAPEKAAVLRVRLCAPDGTTLVDQQLTPAARAECTLTLPDAQPWDTDRPNLYICRAELLDAAGQVLDCRETKFGFRTAVFKADGFYLNGKKTFLRGLNRHQSYPYIGYAAPESLQREDAHILKNELHCNAVRTSHYPQSQYFLDECDRLGLLVFTELPGWQHIGDAAWKDRACEMLREMILQNRSHPSIILWGVRINESVDDDEFYTRTNKIAHELDPSRATSGVRYLEKSHLLEDVYAYNDFSHNGTNAGAKRKKNVTPDMDKALLISECNGHMYPTKSFDDAPHRQEHALRHARVLNAAYADGEHAGCFGWCMFDYATHKDFGSGDRICYHGVLDSFRNPKLAAAVYTSQGGEEPILTVSSTMDIGDSPAGQLGTVYVFTNAERVDLYKNDVFVTTLHKSAWTALPHPPLAVDDTIGELLETQEHFDKSKAAALRDCLLAAGRYGLPGLPLRYKLKLAWCMVRYKMRFDDGVKLYGKYVGNWGGAATRWRFDAKNGDTVVKSVTLCPSRKLHLEVTPSATTLREGDTYDMAAVRVRILDENGSPAVYAQLPLQFAVNGAAVLVGPAIATAEGGMSGTYIRTIGQTGTASLSVTAPQCECVTVTFSVTEKENTAWN
ncbi:MAG: glycoside hydrolase family 2 protein [Subdoligranulum sp.]|nr:glycoside hydrolase family 2 protein [Subdoligranulum sp.]